MSALDPIIRCHVELCTPARVDAGDKVVYLGHVSNTGGGSADYTICVEQWGQFDPFEWEVTLPDDSTVAGTGPLEVPVTLAGGDTAEVCITATVLPLPETKVKALSHSLCLLVKDADDCVICGSVADQLVQGSPNDLKYCGTEVGHPQVMPLLFELEDWDTAKLVDKINETCPTITDIVCPPPPTTLTDEQIELICEQILAKLTQDNLKDVILACLAETVDKDFLATAIQGA